MGWGARPSQESLMWEAEGPFPTGPQDVVSPSLTLAVCTSGWWLSFMLGPRDRLRVNVTQDMCHLRHQPADL